MKQGDVVNTEPTVDTISELDFLTRLELGSCDSCKRSLSRLSAYEQGRLLIAREESVDENVLCWQ
jgi:hypothetical protein